MARVNRKSVGASLTYENNTCMMNRSRTIPLYSAPWLPVSHLVSEDSWPLRSSNVFCFGKFYTVGEHWDAGGF